MGTPIFNHFFCFNIFFFMYTYNRQWDKYHVLLFLDLRLLPYHFSHGVFVMDKQYLIWFLKPLLLGKKEKVGFDVFCMGYQHAAIASLHSFVLNLKKFCVFVVLLELVSNVIWLCSPQINGVPYVLFSFYSLATALPSLPWFHN